MSFMTPKCPECGEEFTVIGRLHWHLRLEHDYAMSDAYDAAGQAFEHLTDEWLEKQIRENGGERRFA